MNRRSEDTPMEEYNKQMGCILFGDLVGYSKLNENELKVFFEQKDKLDKELSKLNVIIQNTWGDAILAIFTNTRDAIKYSFVLRDFFANTDWSEFLFNRPFYIRIGLHAAIFYVKMNHITKGLDVIGSQINRAARLEPVVAPGQIWVTETFKQLDTDVHNPTNYMFLLFTE